MLQSSSPFKSQHSSSALPNRPNVTVVAGHNGRYMATAAAAAPSTNQFKTGSGGVYVGGGGGGGAEFGNRMSHGQSNTSSSSVALQQANRQRVKKETNL